jgi:tetratricopeptide (TPR) repeat protein
LFVKLDVLAATTVVSPEHGRDAAPMTGVTNKRLQAQAVWRQGYKLYTQGDKAGAIKLYEQAKGIDPTYAAPYNSLGRMAGEVDAGVDEQKLYKEAVTRDPQYAPALHNLALTYAQQGETKKAIELEQRAAALSKSDSSYAETLADLKRRPQ